MSACWHSKMRKAVAERDFLPGDLEELLSSLELRSLGRHSDWSVERLLTAAQRLGLLVLLVREDQRPPLGAKEIRAASMQLCLTPEEKRLQGK